MVNVSRENRRYGRVIIENGLRVSMRSIGSEASYNMETRNVSDTGFFLRFEKPGRFPFTPSSIMEVWLTLEEGSTIFFNGKMTRVVHPEEAVSSDAEPGIAVKIIQIEKDEENILREFIRKKAMENESKGKPLAEAMQEGEKSGPSVSKRKTKKKTATASSKKVVSKKVVSKKVSSKKVSSKQAVSEKIVSKKISSKKISSKKISSKQDVAGGEKPTESVLSPPVPIKSLTAVPPPPPKPVSSPEMGDIFPEDEEKAG